MKRVVGAVLSRVLDNRAMVNFLGTTTYVAVLILGTLLSIRLLQLDRLVFSLLAGIGIAGLAVGFALKDIAANFIADIALALRKDYPFRVGDIIETNEYMGIVEEISLRDTRITTFQGQSVFLPNKLIFETAVRNYSLSARRRVDVNVGVSYGDDLEKVRDVVVQAGESVPQRNKDTAVEVFFKDFGDSSISFQVRFWVPFKQQKDYLEARNNAIGTIKKHFDRNGIVIPWPIRTLDFGIKGGVTLAESLAAPAAGDQGREREATETA
jgi:small conductance mechanosensitive channel